MAQNRELIESSVEIAAPVQRVWAIVSDLRRMGERSPQCRKMYILGGPIGHGTRTININSAGWKYWPTTSRVVAFEPERRIAFRIPQNGSVWTYELESIDQDTRLTESRSLTGQASALSNFLTERVLGGTATFEDEVERGIIRTLERIKVEAEETG